MVKIIAPKDCDNSPKRRFLKEFNIAFAERDLDLILSHVTDDIVWDMVGKKRVSGIEDFTNHIEKMSEGEVELLELKSILTHGNLGAINGEMTLKNKKRYSFCDVCKFSGSKSTKIKEMTSYVIELKSEA